MIVVRGFCAHSMIHARWITFMPRMSLSVTDTLALKIEFNANIGLYFPFCKARHFMNATRRYSFLNKCLHISNEIVNVFLPYRKKKCRKQKNSMHHIWAPPICTHFPTSCLLLTQRKKIFLLTKVSICRHSVVSISIYFAFFSASIPNHHIRITMRSQRWQRIGEMNTVHMYELRILSRCTRIIATFICVHKQDDSCLCRINV